MGVCACKWIIKCKCYQAYCSYFLSSQDIILNHQDFCNSFGFKCNPTMSFLYLVWKFRK
eukprot:c30279_g1_i1 orf=151-327(+)